MGRLDVHADMGEGTSLDSGDLQSEYDMIFALLLTELSEVRKSLRTF